MVWFGSTLSNLGKSPGSGRKIYTFTDLLKLLLEMFEGNPFPVKKIISQYENIAYASQGSAGQWKSFTNIVGRVSLALNPWVDLRAISGEEISLRRRIGGVIRIEKFRGED